MLRVLPSLLRGCVRSAGMLQRLCVPLTWLFLFRSPAEAAEPVPLAEAASPVALPAARVTATKAQPQHGELDATLPAVVLEGPTLRRRHLALSDALDGRAGLRVQQVSGFGSSALLSIRGSTAEQVSVYVDDLPLLTVDGSALDLAEIPLGQVERVEVYRGGTPAWLGGQAIGGAMRLLLKAPRGASASVQAGMGSWWARSAEASGSLRPESSRWSVAGGVRWLASEGNYPYWNNNGTTFDSSDDREARRHNNAIARLAGTAVVRREGNDGALLQLRWFGHGLQQGLPGTALYQTEHAQLFAHRQLWIGQWSRPRTWGGERLVVQFSGQWSDTEVDDRRGELGIAWHATQQVLGATTQALWEGRKATIGRATTQLLLRLRASAGELSTIEHLADGETPTPPMQRIQLGGGLAVPIRAGRWTTTAQVGLDGLRDVRQARDRAPFDWQRVEPDIAMPWSARLGTRLESGTTLAVTAAIARAVRPPSLVELFGNSATVVGSPRLQSEQALNANLGLQWQPLLRQAQRQQLELQLFWTGSSQLIQLVQQSPQRAQYQNIAAATLLGAELSWQARWPGAIETALDATFLRTVNVSDDATRRGKQLPMRPGQRVAGRIERPLQLGPVRWMPWIWAQWQGSYPLDAANLAIVPARTLLSGGFRLGIPKGFWLDVRGDNLLGSVNYDLIGYPLPGRTAWVTLGWQGG